MERVRPLVVVLAAVTGGLAGDRTAPSAPPSLEPVVPAGSAVTVASAPPAPPELPPPPEANYAVAW